MWKRGLRGRRSRITRAPRPSDFRLPTPQSVQLRCECPKFVFECGETFEKSRLRFTGGCEQTAFPAVRHELRTIEVQACDVESPGLGECLQAPVVLFGHVRSYHVAKWVEDTLGGVRLPTVAFEFVTGVAAVDPVVRLVQASSGARREGARSEMGLVWSPNLIPPARGRWGP